MDVIYGQCVVKISYLTWKTPNAYGLKDFIPIDASLQIIIIVNDSNEASVRHVQFNLIELIMTGASLNGGCKDVTPIRSTHREYKSDFNWLNSELTNDSFVLGWPVSFRLISEISMRKSGRIRTKPQKEMPRICVIGTKNFFPHHPDEIHSVYGYNNWAP